MSPGPLVAWRCAAADRTIGPSAAERRASANEDWKHTVRRLVHVDRMASSPEFVQYVCGQAAALAGLSYRKMFGEYALYLHGKVVALVCDDQLFVKPTAAGRALLEHPAEASPFPGAKPHFLIDEQLEDQELIVRLLRATESEVPAPKQKKPRSPKGGKRDR